MKTILKIFLEIILNHIQVIILKIAQIIFNLTIMIVQQKMTKIIKMEKVIKKVNKKISLKGNFESILEEDIKEINNETITYNGKIFKNYKRLNLYKPKDRIKKIIYKCLHYIRNEKIKTKNANKKFYNATIKLFFLEIMPF